MYILYEESNETILSPTGSSLPALSQTHHWDLFCSTAIRPAKLTKLLEIHIFSSSCSLSGIGGSMAVCSFATLTSRCREGEEEQRRETRKVWGSVFWRVPCFGNWACTAYFCNWGTSKWFWFVFLAQPCPCLAPSTPKSDHRIYHLDLWHVAIK